MKFIIISLYILLLFGCGSNPIQVDVHTITPEEMLEISGNPKTVGWAHWEDTMDGRICDIYLMPEEWYGNEGWFHSVAGHELIVHCVNGIIH